MNDELGRLCVKPDATIRQTMQLIDAGSAAIALVIDDDGRMIGTVSDGDVRRALLNGATFDDAIKSYANPYYAWVGKDVDRVTVLDIMRARTISQIPVLDEDEKVVGLHLMREVIGGEKKPNVAVVLAGGRGSRLRPHTESLPKPMVTVAGRPILERIVLHLIGSGIETLYLAVRHMHELIEEHFGDGSRFGCAIHYLRDLEQPLGTGGPLALLPDDVRSSGTPLLVMNGDLVTQFDVGRLLRSHDEIGAAMTIGVRNYVHEVPYGVLRVEDGLLKGIEEKPLAAWLVNTGIYVLSSHLVSEIVPDRETQMTDLIVRCLQRAETIHAHLIDGDWLDVGSPQELGRARGWDI